MSRTYDDIVADHTEGIRIESNFTNEACRAFAYDLLTFSVARAKSLGLSAAQFEGGVIPLLMETSGFVDLAVDKNLHTVAV
jgi:hypothetical protein